MVCGGRSEGAFDMENLCPSEAEFFRSSPESICLPASAVFLVGIDWNLNGQLLLVEEINYFYQFTNWSYTPPVASLNNWREIAVCIHKYRIWIVNSTQVKVTPSYIQRSGWHRRYRPFLPSSLPPSARPTAPPYQIIIIQISLKLWNSSSRSISFWYGSVIYDHVGPLPVIRSPVILHYHPWFWTLAAAFPSKPAARDPRRQQI